MEAITPPLWLLQSHQLLGREQEVAMLSVRIRAQGTLLLTGAAGVGKSALALRIAQRLAPELRGGYRAINAERAADCRHLESMMQAAVGPIPRQQEPHGNPQHEPSLLLVVDGCDRHATCIQSLAQQLRCHRPDVHVLVTARSLQSASDAPFTLGPLLVPPLSSGLGAPAALEYPSVRLFVREAARHVPGFALTRENARCAIHICRRLEGIPLAIKLAAAWLPHIGMRPLARVVGPELMRKLHAVGEPSRCTSPRLPRRLRLESSIPQH